MGLAANYEVFYNTKFFDKHTQELTALINTAIYGVDSLTVHVGTSVYLIEGCSSNHLSSCADVLAYGLLEYQHVFYSQAVPIVQLRLGLEVDLFFGKQRIVAWMNRLGGGYAYYGVDASVPFIPFNNDDRTISLQPPDLSSIIQHRLALALESGVLINIPKVRGFSLYVLFGISPKISLDSDFSRLGHYVTTALYIPTVGFRYRF